MSGPDYPEASSGAAREAWRVLNRIMGDRMEEWERDSAGADAALLLACHSVVDAIVVARSYVRPTQEQVDRVAATRQDLMDLLSRLASPADTPPG